MILFAIFTIEYEKIIMNYEIKFTFSVNFITSSKTSFCSILSGVLLETSRLPIDGYYEIILRLVIKLLPSNLCMIYFMNKIFCLLTLECGNLFLNGA